MTQQFFKKMANFAGSNYQMDKNFDWEKIFQFCFDILKDKLIIFNIVCGFFMVINI